MENMIELYYGADLESDPSFSDTVVFYQGFLWEGLRLPFSLLVVSFFNYIQQGPQQFTTLSFVSFTVFNCINVLPELGNGELCLKHLLYYFSLRRSSDNNRLIWSQLKKASMSKANEGKGNAKEDEPVDPDYYKKWQIHHI